jgi:hypothetical protein
VPADIWRMPANFPVESSDGWSFSGMMTPAIDSAYGESRIYTSSPLLQSRLDPSRVVAVREYEGGVFDTELYGPEDVFVRKGARKPVTIPMSIYVDRSAERDGQPVGAIAIEVGDRPLVLAPGEWSDFVRVKFPLLAHGLADVAGEVRFYLRRIEPYLELYCSPVNIDPVDPVAPVSAPKSASAEVARAAGLYYTQGMPEDVNALKERMLSDAEFMDQAALVQREGTRLMDLALERFLKKPAGGFCFFYFSGVDLCSHMMWRHGDGQHPFHDAALAAESSERWSGRAGSTWKDTLHDLYLQMDPIVGRVRASLPPDALLIVMSDHGFAPYYRKFSLNTWLLENGYLVLKPGKEKEKPRLDPEHEPVVIGLDAQGETPVDWTRTRAYGIGFNALYLNLKGREGDPDGKRPDLAGIVVPGAEEDALLAEISAKLTALVDPKNQRHVVLRCDRGKDVYHGRGRMAGRARSLGRLRLGLRQLRRLVVGAHPLRGARGQPGRLVQRQPPDGARGRAGHPADERTGARGRAPARGPDGGDPAALRDRARDGMTGHPVLR